MKRMKRILLLFQEKKLLAFIAFVNKIFQTFAVIPVEISDNSDFYMIIRILLQNLAGKPGFQLEEIFRNVRFANQYFIAAVVILDRGHQIQRPLNVVYDDVGAFYYGNFRFALLVNRYFHIHPAFCWKCALNTYNTIVPWICDTPCLQIDGEQIESESSSEQPIELLTFASQTDIVGRHRPAKWNTYSKCN